MKRAGFLVVLLFMCVFAFMPMNAFADSTEYTDENGIIYILSDDDFNGSEETLRRVKWPEGCTAKTFTIPDGVRVIENFAFRDTPVESIIFPERMTAIYSSAFQNCDNLVEVTLPKGIAFVGPDLFKNCDKLQKITIPSTVKEIGSDAFMNCKSLKEVSMSYGVGKIGAGVFEHCTSLTEIKLPASVRTIGSRAFSDTSLTEIDIRQVSKIEFSAFEDCKNLKTILYSTESSYVADYCFKNCTSLEEIKLPANITTIESDAFIGCTALKTVSFPSNLQVIDRSAFQNCKSLSDISLPSSVKEIGDHAFQSCTQIYNVVLPKSIERIGFEAFADTSISRVSIPRKCKSIDMSAFDTRYFEQIELNCIPSMNWIVFPKTIDVIIGPYVTEIVSNAFLEYEVKSIEIPDTVTSIDENCFKSCKKTELEIRGFKNSQAEKFAAEKGYAFKELKKLSKCTIEAGPLIIKYEGSPVKPEVSIDGLTEGIDYTVEYKNADGTGEAIISCNGIGTYRGRISHFYAIYSDDPVELKTDADFKAIYEDESVKYANENIHAYDSSNKILSKGWDFEVVNGKLTFLPPYIRSFKGTRTVVLASSKEAYAFNVTGRYVSYPNRAAAPSITVGKSKMTVKAKTKASTLGGTKYEIRYRIHGNKTWKKVTTSMQSKTIKSLKKGKQYDVQIRPVKYAYGHKYTCEYSKNKVSRKIR